MIREMFHSEFSKRQKIVPLYMIIVQQQNTRLNITILQRDILVGCKNNFEP